MYIPAQIYLTELTILVYILKTIMPLLFITEK